MSDKTTGYLALFQDGEAELAQLAFQVLLVAAGVLVAQGVELGRVVHVGEMGQLVADDVADERLGHEHEVAGELDDPPGRAVAQFPHAATHLEACGLQPQLAGYLPGQRQQHGVDLYLHCPPNDVRDGPRHVVVI